MTGLDLVLPHLWAGALVLTVSAFAVRLLLGAVLRRDVSRLGDLPRPQVVLGVLLPSTKRPPLSSNDRAKSVILAFVAVLNDSCQ